MRYLGSGKYWRSHLKEHGTDISTEVIYEAKDIDEFKKVSIQYSIDHDIVNSPEWANLKIEEGDGGNTTGGRRWINNGIEEKFSFELEPGWEYGRLPTCVFKDRNKQKEFNSRVDRKSIDYESLGKRHSQLRKERYWSSGSIRSDETKELLRKRAKERIWDPYPCPICSKMIRHNNHIRACKRKKE